MTHTPPGGYPSRRARRRAEAERPQGAFRFTGVGRHCEVTDDVIEMHLAARLEPVAPLDTNLEAPLGVELPEDYDPKDAFVFDHEVDDEVDVAPGGTATLAVIPSAGPVSMDATGLDDEADAELDDREWLSQADAEASEAEAEGEHVGFAGTLARHFEDVPVGYLPAEDIFSDSEADLSERRRRR